MTAVVVVAGRNDSAFAEALRADLARAGHDVTVAETLPPQPGAQVVLLWSAALASTHAVDAQALIGLWSDERLVVARRDDTPLPLGLRDLPSFGPEKTPADLCAALQKRAPASVPASKSHWKAGLFATLSVIAVLGASWYYVTGEKRAAESALLAALQEAAEASRELQVAQAKQLESLKALEQARAAEEAARKSGDAAKLKQAQEAARRAEDEARKQADLVKQREAAALDARKKSADARKSAQAAEVKKAAPKAEVAVASAPPPAAVKSEAPKAEAPKAEAPTAEAPKAETPRAAPAVAAPIVTEAPAKKASPMSRSERERVANEEAARKPLAAAGRAPAVEPTTVASASPAPAAEPSAPVPKAAADHEALYEQALALEQDGKASESIRIYRRAARAGSGKAAKRLGDIYDRGAPGVSRDYAESLQWYDTARQLGESVATGYARGGGGGGGGGGPVVQAPAPVVPAVVAEVPKPETVKAAAEPTPAPAASAETAKPAPPAAAASAASAPPTSSSEPSANMLYLYFAIVLLLIVVAMLWRQLRRSSAAPAQPVSTPQPDLQPPPLGARAAAQPSTDANTLFVSYSHKDRGRVEPIVSAIEEMGRRVWMDRTDITGQAGWAGQIVRAIRECRAVVLMASPNSYASDQVVRELYLAMNHRKTIVPIEVEPAELPDELQYILAPFQHHRLSGGETREVLGRALAAV